MRKICMIVHQDYYRDGRVRRYAESLLADGDEVDVICVRGKLEDVVHVPGLRVYKIPMMHEANSMARYIYEYIVGFILYTLYVLWLYPLRRYDVIHAHNMPDFLIFSALIPKLFGAKLILDIHDAMPEFYMSKYEKTADSGIAKVMSFQEQLSAKLANHVVTANPNFRENIIRRGLAPEKITVVANFPDRRIFDRKAIGKPEDDGYFTLVYPGTIAPRYGLSVAIKALPKLREEIPNLRLLLIGSHNEHQGELKALADELGVTDIVTFQPIVPVQDVPRYMAAADLGIYTAIPDAHMRIATPSKVLEYAIMGLPIVASRLPVLESLFGEDAIAFFSPGDVDQFVQRVITLYHNPEKRQEMVATADREFVTKADWRYEFGKYETILNRLLARPSADAVDVS